LIGKTCLNVVAVLVIVIFDEVSETMTDKNNKKCLKAYTNIVMPNLLRTRQKDRVVAFLVIN
jgi:hypothetical protein